ncbi:MAG: hypothetical protein WC158_03510 [Candidatus Paceibacterota bacterium]
MAKIKRFSLIFDEKTAGVALVMRLGKRAITSPIAFSFSGEAYLLLFFGNNFLSLNKDKRNKTAIFSLGSSLATAIPMALSTIAPATTTSGLLLTLAVMHGDGTST